MRGFRSRTYELWSGKQHTIIATQRGAMAQLDVAYKVMYKPASVIECLAQKLRKPPSQLSLADCARANRELKRQGLYGFKLETSYTQRTFRMRGLAGVGAQDDKFMIDATEADAQPREITIAQYYQERYNIKLERADLPCVLVGPTSNPEKTRVPMELLRLASFQPALINPELQGEMIKQCVRATSIPLLFPVWHLLTHACSCSAVRRRSRRRASR